MISSSRFNGKREIFYRPPLPFIVLNHKFTLNSFTENSQEEKLFSEKLDNQSVLTNKHWVILNEEEEKIVFIFLEANNQLLIGNDGIVERGKWQLG